MSTVCVTSSGIITTLIPDVKTIWAASGSTKMLNYAAGDQLPMPIAPPIILIFSILDRTSGKALIKIARLVIAPVTTN